MPLTLVHSTHELCGEWGLELIQPVPDEMKRLREGAGGGLQFLVAMTALGACARHAPSPTAARTSLRVGQYVPVKTLSPILPIWGFAAEASYLVFDRLVYRGPDGQLVGGLLEDWQSSEGARRFRLTLRPDVHFHDGSRLTADDLLFTLEAIRDPNNESVYASTLESIESFEKVDELSVDIRLQRPVWHFAELLDFGVLPRAALRGQPLPGNPFNEHPIGAGPYRVMKIENGSLELERHQDYYGDPPAIQHISVSSYRSDELWSRLLAHDIDAVLRVPWSKYRFLGHVGTIRTDRSERFLQSAICFNTKRAPFDRAAARNAFASAIDRNRLVARVEHGFGEATEHLDPREPSSIALDLEAARSELGGRTLHLSVVATDSDDLDIAMEIQRQLSAADVTIQIDPDAHPAMTEMSFCTHLEPLPLEFAGYQYGSAWGPEYKDIDSLFQVIEQTQDETTRRSLFQKVEDRILSATPLTILFWQKSLSAYRAEYCGYHMVDVFDGLEKMRPCP